LPGAWCPDRITDRTGGKQAKRKDLTGSSWRIQNVEIIPSRIGKDVENRSCASDDEIAANLGELAGGADGKDGDRAITSVCNVDVARWWSHKTVQYRYRSGPASR
jgi:hypothetical protein